MLSIIQSEFVSALLEILKLKRVQENETLKSWVGECLAKTHTFRPSSPRPGMVDLCGVRLEEKASLSVKLITGQNQIPKKMGLSPTSLQ